MIEFMRDLGNKIVEKIKRERGLRDKDEAFLYAMTDEVPKKGKELLRVIFSFKDREIRLEPIRRVDEAAVEDYLFIIGDYRKQKITFTKLEDLLRGLLEIKKHLDKIGRKIQTIQKASIRRNLREFKALVGRITSTFGEELKNYNKTAKSLREKYCKDVSPALFTPAVEDDGGVVDLAHLECCKAYLIEMFLRRYEMRKGLCHVCGTSELVLSNPAFPGGTPLKIYVVDKKGFMSGIEDTEEAKISTFGICPACLRSLLAADNYIVKKLRYTLPRLRLNVYLVPNCDIVDVERLEGWSEYLRGEFDSWNSFEGLENFQRLLEKYHKYMDASHLYSLYLIFGSKARSAFNIRTIIHDVPVSRFRELREHAIELRAKMMEFFGEQFEKWYLSLSKILETIPIRVRKGGGEILEWAPIDEICRSLLQGYPLSRELLIQRGVLSARIHYYGNYGAYSIRQASRRNRDAAMTRDLLLFNLMLKYFETLSIIERRYKELSISEKLEPLFEKIPEIKKWMDFMNYDEEERALFLLGVLIGEIGAAQYRKGDEKKAILNKIWFEGMSIEQVRTLASRVFEYLRIYRILNERNQIIYSILTAILSKRGWSKSPEENVFYILTGYAFKTSKAITKGGAVLEK